MTQIFERMYETRGQNASNHDLCIIYTRGRINLEIKIKILVEKALGFFVERGKEKRKARDAPQRSRGRTECRSREGSLPSSVGMRFTLEGRDGWRRRREAERERILVSRDNHRRGANQPRIRKAASRCSRVDDDAS